MKNYSSRFGNGPPGREFKVGLIINKFPLSVEQIIKFISEKFIPQKQKASKIPPYFYVNTPIRNEQMINSLDKCKLTAIQITHKLIQNGNI